MGVNMLGKTNAKNMQLIEVNFRQRATGTLRPDAIRYDTINSALRKRGPIKASARSETD